MASSLHCSTAPRAVLPDTGQSKARACASDRTNKRRRVNVKRPVAYVGVAALLRSSRENSIRSSNCSLSGGSTFIPPPSIDVSCSATSARIAIENFRDEMDAKAPCIRTTNMRIFAKDFPEVWIDLRRGMVWCQRCGMVPSHSVWFRVQVRTVRKIRVPDNGGFEKNWARGQPTWNAV